MYVTAPWTVNYTTSPRQGSMIRDPAEGTECRDEVGAGSSDVPGLPAGDALLNRIPHTGFPAGDEGVEVVPK